MAKYLDPSDQSGLSQENGQNTVTRIFVREGTNGFAGQTTLVAGTIAITIPGVTASSRAFPSLVTANTTTLTTAYQTVCTTDTLTIQANVAAGTINIADISTLNYLVIN